MTTITMSEMTTKPSKPRAKGILKYRRRVASFSIRGIQGSGILKRCRSVLYHGVISMLPLIVCSISLFVIQSQVLTVILLLVEIGWYNKSEETNAPAPRVCRVQFEGGTKFTPGPRPLSRRERGLSQDTSSAKPTELEMIGSQRLFENPGDVPRQAMAPDLETMRKRLMRASAKVRENRALSLEMEPVSTPTTSPGASPPVGPTEGDISTHEDDVSDELFHDSLTTMTPSMSIDESPSSENEEMNDSLENIEPKDSEPIDTTLGNSELECPNSVSSEEMDQPDDEREADDDILNALDGVSFRYERASRCDVYFPSQECTTKSFEELEPPLVRPQIRVTQKTTGSKEGTNKENQENSTHFEPAQNIFGFAASACCAPLEFPTAFKVAPEEEKSFLEDQVDVRDDFDFATKGIQEIFQNLREEMDKYASSREKSRKFPAASHNSLVKISGLGWSSPPDDLGATKSRLDSIPLRDSPHNDMAALFW